MQTTTPIDARGTLSIRMRLEKTLNEQEANEAVQRVSSSLIAMGFKLGPISVRPGSTEIEVVLFGGAAAVLLAAAAKKFGEGLGGALWGESEQLIRSAVRWVLRREAPCPTGNHLQGTSRTPQVVHIESDEKEVWTRAKTEGLRVFGATSDALLDQLRDYGDKVQISISCEVLVQDRSRGMTRRVKFEDYRELDTGTDETPI